MVGGLLADGAGMKTSPFSVPSLGRGWQNQRSGIAAIVAEGEFVARADMNKCARLLIDLPRWCAHAAGDIAGGGLQS